jgi:hypothetical protein
MEANKWCVVRMDRKTREMTYWHASDKWMAQKGEGTGVPDIDIAKAVVSTKLMIGQGEYAYGVELG